MSVDKRSRTDWNENGGRATLEQLWLLGKRPTRREMDRATSCLSIRLISPILLNVLHHFILPPFMFYSPPPRPRRPHASLLSSKGRADTVYMLLADISTLQIISPGSDQPAMLKPLDNVMREVNAPFVKDLDKHTFYSTITVI